MSRASVKLFDGATFVHGAVALCHFGKRKREVEDLARIDLALEDKVDQIGQVPPDGCRSSVKMDMREEELPSIERNAVRDADVGEIPSANSGCWSQGGEPSYPRLGARLVVQPMHDS